MRDVQAATKWLYETRIAQFVADSDNYETPDQVLSMWLNFVHIFYSEVHRYGINFRHLGFVRKLVMNAEIQTMILNICVSRTTCMLLRQSFRESTPSISSFKTAAKDRIDRLLNLKADPDNYWTCEFKAVLLKKFPQLLSSVEIQDQTDIRSNLNLPLVLRLVDESIHLQISGNVYTELDRAIIDGESYALSCSDFSIEPRTRRLGLIDLIAGRKRIYAAASLRRGAQIKIVSEAYAHLEIAMSHASLCAATLSLYGKCLVQMAILEIPGWNAESLFARAYRRFWQSFREAWKAKYTKGYFEWLVGEWREAFASHIEWITKKSYLFYSAHRYVAELQSQINLLETTYRSVKWKDQLESVYLRDIRWNDGVIPASDLPLQLTKCLGISRIISDAA